MRGRILCAVGVLWAAGCAQDPLAEQSVYPGLTPFERPTGPLVRVLDTDPATPDKQGLLYTSMRDAQVAASYADRALARLDEPGETESALGEVIYAIAPAVAPPRNPEDYAFGPNWASHGYGLRRSLDRMAGEVVAATERAAASPALREQGPPALRCTENTRERAERVLALSRQALQGEAAAVPALEQIKEQAEALNRGVPAPGESGCGLQDVERRLNQALPGDTARLSVALRPTRALRRRGASVLRSPQRRRS